MSDHDPLETFARETVHQVLAPDFDALVTVSHRRRRTTYLAAGSAAAVVVGMVAVGMQVVGNTHSQAPIAPGPTTTDTHPTVSTPTNSVGRKTPQQIVDDPDSGLRGFAVSPTDPDVKAAVWAFCPQRSCQNPQEAVAVTDNGYQTAAYLRVQPYTDLQWVRGDTFVVRDIAGAILLVSSTETHEINVTTTPSPLRPGERLISLFGPASGRYQHLAIDMDSATAHPLPIPYPEDKSLQLHQHGQETLWGTDDYNVIVSSADGGVSWRPAESPPGVHQLDPVDSGQPDTLAFIQVGDDDFRIADSLFRSTDGGAHWKAVHPTDLAGHGAAWLVVEPDGNLLIETMDPHQGGVAYRLYESDTPAWQSFHRLRQPEDIVGDLIETTVSPDGVQSLYTNTLAGLLLSTDEGRTWGETPDR